MERERKNLQGSERKPVMEGRERERERNLGMEGKWEKAHDGGKEREREGEKTRDGGRGKRKP